jgi:hypothetical protein
VHQEHTRLDITTLLLTIDGKSDVHNPTPSFGTIGIVHLPWRLRQRYGKV